VNLEKFLSPRKTMINKEIREVFLDNEEKRIRIQWIDYGDKKYTDSDFEISL